MISRTEGEPISNSDVQNRWHGGIGNNWHASLKYKDSWTRGLIRRRGRFLKWADAAEAWTTVAKSELHVLAASRLQHLQVPSWCTELASRRFTTITSCTSYSRIISNASSPLANICVCFQLCASDLSASNICCMHMQICTHDLYSFMWPSLSFTIRLALRMRQPSKCLFLRKLIF